MEGHKEAMPDKSMSKVATNEDQASAEGSFTEIYIDPAREAAVRRKFDIYVVPVSVIYLVMATLDRNNVSTHQRSWPVACC
jgi:hypothetical protein